MNIIITHYLTRSLKLMI